MNAFVANLFIGQILILDVSKSLTNHSSFSSACIIRNELNFSHHESARVNQMAAKSWNSEWTHSAYHIQFTSTSSVDIGSASIFWRRDEMHRDEMAAIKCPRALHLRDTPATRTPSWAKVAQIALQISSNIVGSWRHYKKVLFRQFHYCTVYRRSGSVNKESPIPMSYKETSSQSPAAVRPGASNRKSDPKWYGSRTGRSSFLTHIDGNSYCNTCTD